MTDLINVETLINEAKKRGVDFGKGDPYNRLRYYTKIGWLPHMIRKKEEHEVIGHYPIQALEKLVLIEKLKAQNMSNKDISKKIGTASVTHQFLEIVSTPEFKKKAIIYTLIIVFIFIIFNETGIIKIGVPKYTRINEVLKSLPK
jgi:hypothetical protein